MILNFEAEIEETWFDYAYTHELVVKLGRQVVARVPVNYSKYHQDRDHVEQLVAEWLAGKLG